MSLLTGLTLITAGIILIIVLTSWLKLNAFLSLFLVSLLLALFALPVTALVPTLKKGFGDTMASIGLIIIFGAIIGVTLDKAGATMSIAAFILNRTKNKSAPAMALTGFITGLPIFCDSGFIVLSGINNSLTVKSKSNKVFMATVLACSLYSVHCLIPPHPGATAAAGIIGAGIGNSVVIGILVAIPTALAGFLWAKFISRNVSTGSSSEGKTHDQESQSFPLPSAGKSVLPILVPLLLITSKSIMDVLSPGNHSFMMKALIFAGDPVIALFIGMLLSFLLLPAVNQKSINHILTTSIDKAGPIIIITAAGGIFGAVIKATGTGEQAGEFLAQTRLGLLIPFLLAFILKTAQGSSTVAIITAASIIGPMLPNLGFSDGAGKLLVLLSLGAGSMMVSHANDSYFWVITNFSGIESSATLKVYSTATIVMGLTAFGMVLLISLFNF